MYNNDNILLTVIASTLATVFLDKNSYEMYKVCDGGNKILLNFLSTV